MKIGETKLIEELIFTSSERGLQIGKSGFCTVASTPDMASNLTRMLESLSGYRHLFTPGSPEAAKNPVVYSLLQVKVGGEQKYVMSRVADAGIDYSGRSNKLAHHVSLPEKFEKAGSPTRMLLDKQFFCNHWEGDPKQLQPRPLLNKASAPSPCKFWEKVTGDAGWAGELIQACQAGKIIYLIIQPSTPAAALLHEALSLLPRQKQWQTTFSSFYRRLPPNVQCQIRCVMADSPEIEMTRQSQNNIVWDLTKPLGTPTSFLADLARQGKTITGNEMPPTAVIKEKAATGKTLAATPPPSRDKAIPSLTKRPPELPVGEELDSGVEAGSKLGWLKLVISILGLLVIAATFAILFIPGLKEQVLSGFSPSLPQDIVKPLKTNPALNPDPVIDPTPMKAEPVFTRMIPPMVLSPPTLKLPDTTPKKPSPSANTFASLVPSDISFSPQWQAFQKSRFPQPILLIRHVKPISNQIELTFLEDSGGLKVSAADQQWNVSAAGRQIGKIELAKHEQGSQLEFQCDLDDAGTPTVFLDSIDLLNQSVLEIRTASLPPTDFDVGLRFVEAHVDLDNRTKQEKLAFGISGGTLSQTLVESDIELRLFQSNSREVSDEELKASAESQESNDTVDADEESDESELIVEFSVPFNQEPFKKLTPGQRKRLESLNATVNLRFFKAPEKPLQYQWKSFTFIVAETKITARSWKFDHHPIDVVARELKKQLKTMENRKRRGKEDFPEEKPEVEEFLKFLTNVKTETSDTLELNQLMPDRLASPIELTTDNGQNYLVFIDMGDESRLWSPQEMRMSYHGVPRSESN